MQCDERDGIKQVPVARRRKSESPFLPASPVLAGREEPRGMHDTNVAACAVGLCRQADRQTLGNWTEFLLYD